MRSAGISVLILVALPTSALADPEKPSTQRTTNMSLNVTSNAFAANQTIPVEYTCDGSETSPPLSWSNVPKGTKSVAILVEDPDAPSGTFTHWLVTGIPPTTTALPAGALPAGASVATNDTGKAGYAGPCPPSGRHHYHFKVYALDTTLPKPRTKAEFLSAIKGHVLDQGELVATYQRPGGR